MNILTGDELIMKKPHPCGGNRFDVLRVGMDFKLRCKECSHEIMLPRKKAEKGIKAVYRDGRKLSGEELQATVVRTDTIEE